MLFEETHASASIGKAPRAVEPADFEASRGQKGIAMINVRSSYRFVNDRSFPVTLNYIVGKREKRQMNVERGNSRSNLVYVYGIHKRAPMPILSIYITASSRRQNDLWANRAPQKPWPSSGGNDSLPDRRTAPLASQLYQRAVASRRRSLSTENTNKQSVYDIHKRLIMQHYRTSNAVDRWGAFAAKRWP